MSVSLVPGLPQPALRAMRSKKMVGLSLGATVAALNHLKNKATAKPQAQPAAPLPLPKTLPDRFERSQPLSQYLGEHPDQLTFQQRMDDCYILSSIDAIQHHPKRHEILKSILVKESGPSPDLPVKKFTFHFPSGGQSELEESEIGLPQGKHTPVKGPRPIQMWQLAYAKMVSAERNKDPEFAPIPYPNDGKEHSLALACHGLPSEAMEKMLVGHPGAKYTHCFRQPASLAKLVREIARDPEHDYLLCAISQGLGEDQRVQILPPKADGRERGIPQYLPFHAYSIRRIRRDGSVTVADPRDTAKKVDTLTAEEFGKVFSCVDGVRFKKQSLS